MSTKTTNTKKTSREKPLLFMIFFISAAIFSISLWMQFGQNIHPCKFCVFQRQIYLLIAVLALFGLCTPFKTTAVRLVQLSFLCGCVIAGYHVGIQYHWLQDPCLDTMYIYDITTFETMSNASPMCYEVNWKILGVSTSLWNALASIAALVCIATYRRRSARA